MRIRTQQELKDALLIGLSRSDSRTEAYRRIANVIIGDIDAVWGNARSYLGDMGLSKADIDKIRSIIKKRF